MKAEGRADDEIANCTDGADTEPVSEGLFLMLQIVIVLIWIVGIPGNALSIAAVIKYRKMRTAGNIFVTNLSIADGLYFTMSLPIRFATFHIGRWVFTDVFCTFFGGFSHFLNGVSVLCLSAIALNRLLFVQHSKHYQKMYNSMGLTLQILCIWVSSFILTIALPMSGLWGGYDYYPPVRSCTFRPCQDALFKIVIVSLGFWLPASFIVVCYGLIFRNYRASQRRVNRWAAHRNSVPTSAMIESVSEKSEVESMPAEGSGVRKGNSVRIKSALKGPQMIKVKAATESNKLTNASNNSTLNPVATDVQAKRTKISTIVEESVTNQELAGKALTPQGQTLYVRQSSTTDPSAVLLKSRSWSSSLSEPSNSNSEKSLSTPPKSPHEKEAAGDFNDTHNQVQKTETRLGQEPKQLSVSFSAVNEPHLPDTLIVTRAKKPSICSTSSKGSSRSAASKRVKFALTTRQQREAILMTIMMVCIFTLFTICILPYFVVNIVNPNLEDPTAYLIALMCTWFNGCINPAIYALMNTQYRSAYRALLRLPCGAGFFLQCYCRKVKPLSPAANLHLKRTAAHM